MDWVLRRQTNRRNQQRKNEWNKKRLAFREPHFQAYVLHLFPSHAYLKEYASAAAGLLDLLCRRERSGCTA
jgi:hypothetical protein